VVQGAKACVPSSGSGSLSASRKQVTVPEASRPKVGRAWLVGPSGPLVILALGEPVSTVNEATSGVGSGTST
jgi:hypothetical protein